MSVFIFVLMIKEEFLYQAFNTINHDQWIILISRTLTLFLQLVESMRKVNFTLDGNTYSFDENGDFTDGYDLIMWMENNDERNIEIVGRFLLKNGDVEILSQFQWMNNTVSCTVSNSSYLADRHKKNRWHSWSTIKMCTVPLPFKAHLSFILQLPTSKCSEACLPGTVKNQSEISCCYGCIDCPEGKYTDRWGKSEFVIGCCFFILFHLCTLKK